MGVREIDLSGIPLIGKGLAKDNFQKTTEDALSNIAGGRSQIMTKSLFGYN